MTTDPLETLTNYYPISPLILTAGQPMAEQIALLAAATDDLIEIALNRQSSFWAECQPEIQAR
ncbi:MAG: hypothetical protein WAW26_21520 [Anaerolineae bacterium]